MGLFPGAKKWGTFFERIQWIVNTLLEAVEDILLGTVEAVVWLFIKSYDLIEFALIGLILLTIRALVIWLVLESSKVAVTLTKIIDAVLEFLFEGFNAVYYGLGKMVSFVNHDIVGALNTIPGVHLPGIPWSGTPWKKMPSVSPDQVKLWTTSLPTTCARFDGAFKIVLYLIRLAAHDSVCPMVRAVYPLEQTYNTYLISGTFGWMYYGSAEPTLHEPNKNCIGREPLPTSGVDSGMQKSLDYTCILLGTCYLFLEIYFLLILVRAVLVPLYPALKRVFELIVYFWEILVVDSVELIVTIIKVILLV